MQNITYSEMLTRYGKDTAQDFLMLIEKAVNIRNGFIGVDEETRLKHAFDAMDGKTATA